MEAQGGINRLGNGGWRCLEAVILRIEKFEVALTWQGSSPWPAQVHKTKQDTQKDTHNTVQENTCFWLKVGILHKVSK